MDWTVIEQKLESLRRSLRRIEEKCPQDADILAKDFDAQDIVALNLTRAVQLCVDVGTHLVADTECPPPDTMGQVFDILNEAGIIDRELADRMKKAVGFRNLAVHNCRVSVDNIPRLWRYLLCQEALEGLPEDLKAKFKC